jgi:hypothetical protein
VLAEAVALKFLPAAVARDAVAIDELKDETRRARRLTHAGIVRIHDFVQDASTSTAAIAMELVEGTTLAQLRLQQPGKVFSAAQLAPLVAQLCAALDYAHADAKAVHRDLKPANLLVTNEGRLKIADFGIARALSETHTRLTNRAHGTSGTLLYMSPEQLLNRTPRATDDVYGLGATLYELLASKPPFTGGDLFTLIRTVMPPPPGRRRAALEIDGPPIPRAWEETIMACLAKGAEDRPQTTGEVLVRIQEKVTSAPSKSESPRVWPALRAGLASKADLPVQLPMSPATQAGPEPVEGERQPQLPQKRGRWLSLAAGIALIAVGASYYFAVLAPERARHAELARAEEKQKLAASVTERRRLEQRESSAVAAKIDALVDGAPVAQRASTEAAVRTYLATAPVLPRADIERRWNQRAASWEAARLAAARGGILVRTTPPGADVTVGALEHGASPLTLKEVKLGEYPVVVTAAGYDEWRGKVEVKENEFATVTAASSWRPSPPASRGRSSGQTTAIAARPTAGHERRRPAATHSQCRDRAIPMWRSRSRLSAAPRRWRPWR